MSESVDIDGFATDLVAILDVADEVVPDVDALRDLLASERGREALPEVWALKTLSEDPIGDLHKDNFTHPVTVVGQCGGPADLITRLAALFHDIGKPLTRRVEAGNVTFHHHEAVGARLVRVRLASLGFAEEVAESVVDTMLAASRVQSYEESWSDSGVRRVRVDAGENWDRAVTLAHADVTSRHASVHRRVHQRVDSLTSRVEYLAEEDARRAERPVLSGDDLRELGVEPGPAMGRILRWLLEENRAGRLTERDDAAAAVRAGADGAIEPLG